MPYIKTEDRIDLGHGILPDCAGELNYLFTKLATDYIDTKGLSYQTINDIVGALEGAKLEFVRRIVNPYEDSKIETNGDVY